MLISDVNILVYAFRRESPRHDEYRQWLTDVLVGAELFGVSELVLSGFLRIVTNHRVFIEPSTPEAALAFCDSLLRAPSATRVRPSDRHWTVFTELCQSVRARANVIPDAFHAALAMEHGATWVTTDRGFARFPGLRWIEALEDR
jgi:hypothetical protein